MCIVWPIVALVGVCKCRYRHLGFDMFVIHYYNVHPMFKCLLSECVIFEDAFLLFFVSEII